jgi:hypothetical protein
MEIKALAVGRTMTWANVAGHYNRLFINITDAFRQNGALAG